MPCSKAVIEVGAIILVLEAAFRTAEPPCDDPEELRGVPLVVRANDRGDNETYPYGAVELNRQHTSTIPYAFTREEIMLVRSEEQIRYWCDRNGYELTETDRATLQGQAL